MKVGVGGMQIVPYRPRISQDTSFGDFLLAYAYPIRKEVYLDCTYKFLERGVRGFHICVQQVTLYVRPAKPVRVKGTQTENRTRGL